MLKNPACLKHLSIVVSALVLVSCTPAQFADPGTDRPHWQRVMEAERTMPMPLPTGVSRLTCERRPDTTVVQRFSPGQEFRMVLHNHRFIIPGNALDTVATFSMTVRSADQVEVLIHPRGDFAEFSQTRPATLMLGFDHCQTPADIRNLRVRRYSYGGNQDGEDIGGTANMRTRSISVPRTRLSGYIIAQN